MSAVSPLHHPNEGPNFQDGRRPRRARSRAPLGEPRDFEVSLDGNCRAACGGPLPDNSVRLRRYGRRNGPIILVMGGISAGRHIAGETGWWRDLIGENAPIDLLRYNVVGLDFTPNDDVRVKLTPQTQARLICHVMDVLETPSLHAIIGASYGGMVGLALAAMAPARVDNLCIISAAHRPSSLGLAWRGVQRRLVEHGLERGCAEDMLALARELAMITYRSSDEFDERFHRILGQDGLSDLDRYLVSRGRAYAGVMGAKRWLSLSEAIDRCEVTPEAIKAPTTLIACPTDQLVPLRDVQELARRLPNFVAHHALPSIFGHDAFLKEPARLGEILKIFLRSAV